MHLSPHQYLIPKNFHKLSEVPNNKHKLPDQSVASNEFRMQTNLIRLSSQCDGAPRMQLALYIESCACQVVEINIFAQYIRLHGSSTATIHHLPKPYK